MPAIAGAIVARLIAAVGRPSINRRGRNADGTNGARFRGWRREESSEFAEAARAKNERMAKRKNGFSKKGARFHPAARA
jgi:hypothetical protein